MKIAFVAAPSAKHQIETASALIAGVETHGDKAVLFRGTEFLLASKESFDAVCLWGWRKGELFRPHHNVLVMERAYLADRFRWVSLGWNGLNGRATWPQRSDPSRWLVNFAPLMKPWRHNPDGYALLLGQVTTDMSVRNINYLAWAHETAEFCRQLGYTVVYRPHPKQSSVVPHGIMQIHGTLEEALHGARFTISYNSNSGVDSVMAGVPAVIMDRGGMAWDVASHHLECPENMVDRTEWGASLAWKQWLPRELSDGTAWDIVKEAMPKKRLIAAFA